MRAAGWGPEAIIKGIAADGGPVAAYVALGSNLGDREAYLHLARTELAASEGVSVAAASRIYETAPVGPPPQDRYLNAVLKLETRLAARALLDRLLDIERVAGRERGAQRWGPRRLDLDLLLYNDRQIDEPGLSVPHPRLHERAFVLAPLCDLAADEVHPRLPRSFGELLQEVLDPEAVRVWRGAGSHADLAMSERRPWLS